MKKRHSVEDDQRFVHFTDWRQIAQRKAKSGLSLEEATDLANEWELEGYEVDLNEEEHPGDAESAVPRERTFEVRASRDVAEVSEESLQKALDVLRLARAAEEAAPKKTRSKK